jgi:predicted phage-related endonuclease
MPEVYSSIERPFMLASLDGVCIDNKIILEVKCTNKKNHELAKNGKIPDYYMPQVQHQISVCDVDQCHYFSFDGSCGVIVVVDRDEDYIKRMIEMEHEFYQEMTNEK